MMGFNTYNHIPEPSEIGEKFKPNVEVRFLLNGRRFTGKVKKQLSHAALVTIDDTPENEELVFQKNGVIVVNYRQLEKI